MKKDQVQVGGTFVAKVSGQLARVRINGENPHGGWDATNVATGRKVRIKSAQRLRRAVKEDAAASPQAGASTSADAPVAEVDDGPRLGASRCATVKCKGEPALTYRGKPLCQRCWERVCRQDETAPAEGAATTENAEAATASAHDEENKMATKKTTKSKKATKGSAKHTTKAAAKTKAPAEKKPKRVSALDAAAQVLKSAGKPMRAQELIAKMAERGLWTSPGGKTPHATLYAAMVREERDKGRESRFHKVDRGQFAFNGKAA